MSVALGSTGSSVDPELLNIKHAQDATILYPNHAYAKGGLGVLLSTSQARGGIERLPQATRRSQSARSALDSSTPKNAKTGFNTNSMDIFQPGSSHSNPLNTSNASKAWEQRIKHPHNFVSTGRSARSYDVPAASRWSSLSFYENDPIEVRRHMAIMDWSDALHAQSKLHELEEDRSRHDAWAVAQRETFARQRLEQASKYTLSGVRPRSAYANLGATAAALAAHSNGGDATSMSALVGAPLLDNRISSPFNSKNNHSDNRFTALSNELPPSRFFTTGNYNGSEAANASVPFNGISGAMNSNQQRLNNHNMTNMHTAGATTPARPTLPTAAEAALRIGNTNGIASLTSGFARPLSRDPGSWIHPGDSSRPDPSAFGTHRAWNAAMDGEGGEGGEACP